MKTFIPNRRTVLLTALVGGLLTTSTLSWAASSKKNPTSKIYVAEVEGESEIDTGEKIENLTDKSVHQAQGAVIQTKGHSTNAMVYSNGTGIYLDEDTRLEVDEFAQEPFAPDRQDLETEPSISKTSARLVRGSVGICTSRLVAGSKMEYNTPNAQINIRGQRVVIEANNGETVVTNMEGEVTVRAGAQDRGGVVVKQGQQVIIRERSSGPPEVILQDIPDDQYSGYDDKVAMACMARRTVYFESVEKEQTIQGLNGISDDGASEEEIVAVEVTPTNAPTEFTISPATIGGGGTG